MARLLRNFHITGWRRHLPLPGNPDFAFPSCRLAVFVDGCFWHGHNCRNLTPATNVQLWREKFARNKARRVTVRAQLRRIGWATLSVWECHLRKRPDRVASRLVAKLKGRKKAGRSSA